MNNDLYQSVTNRIISALDAGTPPWIRPWQDADSGIPRNLTNEHPYRGINLLLLNLESMMRGYSDSRWLTFKQAQALGAHVRKGETGAPIVFFKWKEVEAAPDEELPEEDRKVVPLLRAYLGLGVVACPCHPAGFDLLGSPVRHSASPVRRWG